MKADVLQRVQDLSTAQVDSVTIEKFYRDVVFDLGQQEWLVNASLIPIQRETATYDPPDTLINYIQMYYDDRVVFREQLRNLESVSPHWRDERGTAYVYVREFETNQQFTLFRKPDRNSADFNFLFGSPLGREYPAYAVAVVHTETRDDLPTWLELPVAFEILAREFARESDHKDPNFSQACHQMSQMLLDMVRQ